MPQNRRNQGGSQHLNAGNRLAELQALENPTRRQQRVMNTLQGRVNAQGGPAPAPSNLQGLTQQQGQISGTAGNLALQQLESGGFQNPFQPELAARLNNGDLMGLRNDAYNTQYDYLTRDLGQLEQQQGQDVAQSLADRGITYSNDPNSRYQQEMRDYNNRFDRARADARAQASQFAGQEAQNMFGMNEQLIANQFQQQYDTRNQRANEINVLSGLGQPGYMGYSGLRDVDQARRLQNQQFNRSLAKSGGGGGGGGQQQLPYEGQGAFNL